MAVSSGKLGIFLPLFGILLYISLGKCFMFCPLLVFHSRLVYPAGILSSYIFFSRSSRNTSIKRKSRKAFDSLGTGGKKTLPNTGQHLLFFLPASVSSTQCENSAACIFSSFSSRENIMCHRGWKMKEGDEEDAGTQCTKNVSEPVSFIFMQRRRERENETSGFLSENSGKVGSAQLKKH